MNELQKERLINNSKKITLSKLKNTIKRFKNNNMSYFDYYKHILLNNYEYWFFKNPMTCKPSFCTPENVLRFMVFKKLIKQGYKITKVYKGKYNFDFEYFLNSVN
jgi:hypothetical protein